jgi:predicted transcriptional regulator
MAKRSVPKPTEAELVILRVLWERGPSTVRQIHDVLSEQREFAYTTTLKLIQIMNEKGLTCREERGRVHVYSVSERQDQTQRRLVSDLLDRAFGGSAVTLVMHALAAKPAPPEELREIQRLLNAHKEKDGG